MAQIISGRDIFVTLAPQGEGEAFGKSVSLSSTGLVFRRLSFYFSFNSFLHYPFGNWAQLSPPFLGSHVISIFKSKVKCSIPWQWSKVWRPHGPSALNSFSAKSKLIPLESSESDELRTAVNKQEKRAPGGQNGPSPSQLRNGMWRALTHTFISY